MDARPLLGALGLALCLLMSGLVLSQARRLARPPYLALVFLEAALYFLGELLGSLGGPRALGLALNWASSLYGLPALWLYARDAAGEPTPRPLRHFIPALALLPLGTGLALHTAARGFKGGAAAAAFLVLLPLAQTLQLALYGRAGLAAAARAEARGASPWPRRALLAALGGYAAFLALTWVSLGLLLLRELGGGLGPSLALPGSLVATLLAWTLGLAALWGSEGAEARRGQGGKYGGRPLPAGEAAAILARLRALLAGAEDLGAPSLEPRSLARRLGLPYYLLSRAANEGAGKSLGELLNEERVERAKRLLASGEGSVLEIGLAAGFRSKSTFNEVFRRATGRTPGEFRREARG